VKTIIKWMNNKTGNNKKNKSKAKIMKINNKKSKLKKKFKSKNRWRMMDGLL
jgi:hypothetical protein